MGARTAIKQKATPEVYELISRFLGVDYQFNLYTLCFRGLLFFDTFFAGLAGDTFCAAHWAGLSHPDPRSKFEGKCMNSRPICRRGFPRNSYGALTACNLRTVLNLSC